MVVTFVAILLAAALTVLDPALRRAPIVPVDGETLAA
jgi:hypothetical protein